MSPFAFLSAAPEFVGIKGWINSKPLRLEDLRGKVVMLDFWTYSCVNCLRTLPHWKQLHKKYAQHGFVLIGVHTPEFRFEKDAKNVQAAVKRLGIKYPVALDSDNATWKVYGNRYWPLHFIIDPLGKIRHSHVGEGGYNETEQKVVELLKEAGKKVQAPKPKFAAQPFKRAFGTITPEIYLGAARSPGFGSSAVCTPEGCDHYVDPEPQGGHRQAMVYLSGDFKQEEEYLRQLTPKEAYILLRYRAAEVNVVLGLNGGKPYEVEILMDGKPVPKSVAGRSIKYVRGKSIVRVSQSGMYQLVKMKGSEVHEIKLVSRSTDFTVYTFTFG